MKRKKAARLSGPTLAVFLALTGTGLLLWPEVAAEGIRRGLDSCGGILIPSLFPFMTLCCFLGRSGAARHLSLPLTPLTTRVYKLPEEAGVAVLLSLLGGYPAGSKMISRLLAQGVIDKSAAERMLWFCVCASPSFLISAVGAGMLGGGRAGTALFISQAGAALLLGAAVSFHARPPEPRPRREPPPSPGAAGGFVDAVSDASSSMLAMCALAVLFSGLGALVSHSGIPELFARFLCVDRELAEAVAAGIMEVSGGCLAAARLGGERAAVLISVFCSFGGLSVIFQVVSCFEGERPRLWPLLAGRLAHALIALGLMLPLYRKFCADAAVMSAPYAPVLRADGKTWLMSVCLICMCAILFSGQITEKREK